MIYTLYHKDIPVFEFKVEEDEITDVLTIMNNRHLPVGVFKDYERGISQRQQFKAWWRSRAIPASRQNLRDALEVLGNITTEQLVTRAFGLSLSDQYWAKPIQSSFFIFRISTKLHIVIFTVNNLAHRPIWPRVFVFNYFCAYRYSLFIQKSYS